VAAGDAAGVDHHQVVDGVWRLHHPRGREGGLDPLAELSSLQTVRVGGTP